MAVDPSTMPPRALANFFVKTMTLERWGGLGVRDAYREYRSWVNTAHGTPVSLRDFRRELYNAGWRWPREDGRREVLQLTR